MNTIGIIPARFASTRLPGKPLIDIGGKTMIQRVYEQAKKALDHVFVATDDEKILKAVESFGGIALMTSPLHRSGTDRCAEALTQIMQKLNFAVDVVINIQGDEPFINPEQLILLTKCFDDKTTDIATLVKPIKNNDDIFNPNQVKVIHDKHKRAIYFSRSPIPYIRNHEQSKWSEHFHYLKHIGIYAYRSKVLAALTKLTSSALETAESLEQNRWIENSFSIRVKYTNDEGVSIDTPEDLEKVKKRFL
jgi:3-deoxy-manno-octulosonate cytidylyltransferase (CMP-KDO synthetase)